MLPIPLGLVLAAASVSFANDPDDVATFKAPVRLTAGEGFVGQDQLYPSPALFDVDGDGVEELIVGDLRGSLMVHEPIEGSDRTKWSKAKPLHGIDGEPLEFNNW